MAQVRGGVYYLNAVIAYRLSSEAMDALHAGVPLGIRLDIEFIDPRRWWFDNDSAALRQSYQLEYDALSERYIVLNVNSGDQASFGSLFAALEISGASTACRSSIRPSSTTTAATTCGCVPCSTKSSFQGPCGCSPSGDATGRSRANGTDGRCEANKKRIPHAARGLRDTAVARRPAVVHARHGELGRLRAAAVLDSADQFRRASRCCSR